jgi:hypothetical protein
MSLHYIGTKIIKAVPMNLLEAEKLLERNIGYKGLTDSAGDADGYLVTYDNGQDNEPNPYQSWSTKSVFESDYRSVENMTFGLAIEALKKGKKVSRSGWNEKGLWLELQTPDQHSKMTLPYIFMNYPGTNAKVPWIASQTDVLAEDWQLV